MRERILIVEDDGEILASLKEAAEGEGFEVVGVKSLQAARLALIERFDIVLMDGNVQGQTSPALIARMRNDGFVGRIVAMSDNPDLREEQVLAGCDLQVQEKLRVISTLISLFPR